MIDNSRLFVLQEQVFLTISNYVFTFIFGLEMFVKVSIICVHLTVACVTKIYRLHNFIVFNLYFSCIYFVVFIHT